MRKYFLTVILIIVAVCQSYGIPPKGYRLVWSDEFNGNSIDTASWTFEVGDNGWGNNEKQYYTPGNNVDVSDGMLTITARKEDARYTSARIVTKDKRSFTYGYVEIRAKLPQGTGTWPALWMLGENITKAGWPNCGELDIMEHVGKHPGYIHSSVHDAAGYGNTPFTGIIKADNPFGVFHNYSMEWTKDNILFYMDDKIIYEYAPANKNAQTWPFDKPMFIICNVAIGGNWGGPVIDDKIFPQKMVLDYVRVYQQDTLH